MLIDFYNRLIWHTVYWVNLQHDSYWFTYLTYVLLPHYLGNHYLLSKFSSKVWHGTSDDRVSSAWNLRTLFIQTSDFRIVLMLTLLTIEYEAWCRIICIIVRQFKTWPICDSAWCTHEIACRRALWTMLLTNNGRDVTSVWMKNYDILNTRNSNWTWTRTGCADKLDVVLDCATLINV